MTQAPSIMPDRIAPTALPAAPPTAVPSLQESDGTFRFRRNAAGVGTTPRRAAAARPASSPWIGSPWIGSPMELPSDIKDAEHDTIAKENVGN